MRGFILRPHAVIVGMLGTGAIVLLEFIRARKSSSIVWIIGVAIVTAALTADQTRVFSFITFPLFVMLFLEDTEFLDSIRTRYSFRTLLMANLIPWIWVWGGVVRTSALGFDIAYLVHTITGRLAPPENIYYWPF